MNARLLDGSTALVTGATGGIGSAIAHHLAAEGARVILTYLDDPGNADALVAAIRDRDGTAQTVRTDVRDPESVRSTRLAAEETYGPVDILISAAGTYPRILWTEMEPPDWESQLRTNLTSHYLMARELTPGMIRRGQGRIITLGSVLAAAGRHDLAAYIAAKAGVEGLTRALARELGPHGITANCIAPGSIQVPAEDAVVGDPEAMHQRQMGRQCIKRRGLPDDVAAAAAFLAGPHAGFITGQTLRVDGGWILD